MGKFLCYTQTWSTLQISVGMTTLLRGMEIHTPERRSYTNLTLSADGARLMGWILPLT